MIRGQEIQRKATKSDKIQTHPQRIFQITIGQIVSLPLPKAHETVPRVDGAVHSGASRVICSKSSKAD